MCLLIKFYCFIVKLDISTHTFGNTKNRQFSDYWNHCKEQQTTIPAVCSKNHSQLNISIPNKIYLEGEKWCHGLGPRFFKSHLWLNRHAHSTRIIRVERKFILEIVQIPLINSWPKLPSRDKYPGKLVTVAVSGAGGDLIKVARGMATSCQSLQNLCKMLNSLPTIAKYLTHDLTM